MLYVGSKPLLPSRPLIHKIEVELNPSSGLHIWLFAVGKALLWARLLKSKFQIERGEPTRYPGSDLVFMSPHRS